MKILKKILYYLAIFLPILLIYQLMVSSESNVLTMSALISYIFIYRPLIDYCELIRKGISKKEAKKIFVPIKSSITRYRYFRELYFK